MADIFHVFYKRYDILKCICDGQIDKREVEDQIDSSRPTIDRAYRELEDLGMLTSTGTCYELTSFGDLCCTEFARTEDALQTISSMKEILSYLPRDAGLDLGLLKGAEVHYAQEHAPQEPFMEIVNVAMGASEVAGYSSTIMPHYVDSFHSLVVEGEVPTTLVFTEDVIETGYENYEQKFGEIVEADHATVYETSLVYTYGVAIGDDAVAVPVGDELDRLQAVIVNDTEAAVTWGHDFLGGIIESEQTHRVVR
ncbi:MAG: helix-turn-helix transcriptional regulator [Halorientalis sp.]